MFSLIHSTWAVNLRIQHRKQYWNDATSLAQLA